MFLRCSSICRSKGGQEFLTLHRHNLKPWHILRTSVKTIMKNEFLTSGQLMEAVRKLDYKVQYKVCEAFFQMMVEEGFGDDSEMCLRFHDTYESINPRYLEYSLMQLHFAVNDMDNAIYEIDIYEPGLFVRIARRLGEVIEGKNKDNEG